MRDSGDRLTVRAHFGGLTAQSYQNFHLSMQTQTPCDALAAEAAPEACAGGAAAAAALSQLGEPAALVSAAPLMADPEQLAAFAASQQINAGQQMHMAHLAQLAGQVMPEPGGQEGIPTVAEERKPGSGRPAGVQCKCKCCGAAGFYRRSCGRKHRCLIGKCGPGGPGNMGSNALDPDGEAEEAPTMYQVCSSAAAAAAHTNLAPSHLAPARKKREATGAIQRKREEEKADFPVRPCRLFVVAIRAETEKLCTLVKTGC